MASTRKLQADELTIRLSVENFDWLSRRAFAENPSWPSHTSTLNRLLDDLRANKNGTPKGAD